MTLAALQPKPDRIAPLVPLANASAMLMAGLAPVPESRIPLADAIGLCLARPLVVERSIPKRSIALRPGWAVSSSETIGAGPYSPTRLTTSPSLVAAGEDLPFGTDAILPEDAVWRGPAGAEASDTAAPGTWIRRAGDDFMPGTAIRPAGDILSAIDVAIAEAAGLEFCHVRRPRLTLLEAGAKPNSPALTLIARLAEARGAEVVRAFDETSSEPRPNLVVGLLGHAPREARPVAERLALQPGEDAWLGTLGPSAVVLIPDRIADALAIWLVVLAPCLDLLSGRVPVTRAARGRLTRKLTSQVGLSEIALLRDVDGGFEPLAAGDLPLSVIARASHWLLLPPESEGFPAGSTVAAERWSDP